MSASMLGHTIHDTFLGMQIKLLRILGHLGVSDKQASDNMYSIVAEAMRKGNTGHTIGNAIVSEAVRTIANIYPNPVLLQSGGHCSQPNTALHLAQPSHKLHRHAGVSDVLAACQL